MSKGDKIRIRGILLGEIVQQAMGARRIELGMSMQVKGNRSSVITVMDLDTLHGTVLSRMLDEEELLFLTGEQANTFDAEADECDAFDSDVDDEPTAQSIFMANLYSAGPANLQAGPSNASILSEVHRLENPIDHNVTNQDDHEIHNEVQQANVIDSTSVDMGNSNVIPYKQYLSVNNTSAVPSCASSDLNDACVLYDDDVYVPHDPIATELKIYKEQVAIYEQRAKFELTESEQRMDDQMRMLIQNRNKTEENLKKELHSIKLQLNSTMETNKIIEETVYDQKAKTALGAQNPFYLRQAKQAQPALYDDDELLKPHHVAVIVPSSEEDLELAEITRNLEKCKAEELKANAPPLPVLPPATMYPPNTPVHLVPRTLPTTCQVNIGLYVITQLFWDFKKTCKKRITPTGITEGERGFEQTKWCYLTEVIPFFNLYKEHFDGIQKSLVTEVRAMKSVFENLEAEVDQNEIDLKSGEIEQKNLLITNENLIANSIAQDVFYTVTNSALTASRFHDLSIAYNVVMTYTNVPIIPSTGVNTATTVRRSQPKSNTTHDKTLPADRVPKMKVEEHPRKNKSKLIKTNRVDSSISFKRACPLTRITKPKSLSVKQWKPTGRLIPLGGQCPLVRPTAPTNSPTPVESNLVVQIVLWYLDSTCSKHMTGDRSRLRNFVNKFIGTVRFGNDHFGAIMGYGDFVIGDSVISRVYYVEGLRHNLFSIGQFCDSDLEVAFRKHMCFVRDLDGVDLIKGNRGTNLYTIYVEDMMRSSPICLLSKASKNKS
ncbi:hypothetical protein Tco_0354945 [Tanacetum coccineum]